MNTPQPPPPTALPDTVGADTHSSDHRHFVEDPRLCVNHQGTLDTMTVYDASALHKIFSFIS